MLEQTECRAISPDIYITEYKRITKPKKRRKLRKEAITLVITWAVIIATWGWIGWTAAGLWLGAN